MMKQNTTEWLQMRKTHVGGSDAPIIMGVSKFKRNGRFKTPYLLWQEKLDLLPPEQENAAMRFGKDNEEKARNAYEKMTGEMVYPHVCFHKEFPYLMASLDGINLDENLIVEIKNAGKEDHEMARQDKVPSHYYPQLQHQMACKNIDRMHYFSFNQGEGVIVEIKKEDAYLNELYEKERAFWNCLKNFEAPPLTDKDYVKQDEKWAQKMEALLALKEKKKEIVAQEKALIDELKFLSNGENAFYGNLLFSSHVEKGRVQYSKIPQLEGVNLDQYRGAPIQKWRAMRAK